jgi:hypothetical protein
MGVLGAAVLAQEQRQLYSFLSTVLKMARCKIAGVESGKVELTGGSYCLAAGQAAVGLLKMDSPAVGAGRHQLQAIPATVAAMAAAAAALKVGTDAAKVAAQQQQWE